MKKSQSILEYLGVTIALGAVTVITFIAVNRDTALERSGTQARYEGGDNWVKEILTPTEGEKDIPLPPEFQNPPPIHETQ